MDFTSHTVNLKMLPANSLLKAVYNLCIGSGVEISGLDDADIVVSLALLSHNKGILCFVKCWLTVVDINKHHNDSRTGRYSPTVRGNHVNSKLNFKLAIEG